MILYLLALLAELMFLSTLSRYIVVFLWICQWCCHASTYRQDSTISHCRYLHWVVDLSFVMQQRIRGKSCVSLPSSLPLWLPRVFGMVMAELLNRIASLSCTRTGEFASVPDAAIGVSSVFSHLHVARVLLCVQLPPGCLDSARRCLVLFALSTVNLNEITLGRVVGNFDHSEICQHRASEYPRGILFLPSRPTLSTPCDIERWLAAVLFCGLKRQRYTFDGTVHVCVSIPPGWLRYSASVWIFVSRPFGFPFCRTSDRLCISP